MSSDREVRHDNICPHCKAALKFYECVSEARRIIAHKDDFTICVDCGQLSQFDENLQLVPASLEAMLDMQKRAPLEWVKVELAQKMIQEKNKIELEQQLKKL